MKEHSRSQKIFRAFLVITASIAVVFFGAPQAASAAEPMETTESAAPNDLIIKNGSIDRSMTICENAASETACGTSRGVLYPGENSRDKFGWADADMIYIADGCELQQYGYVNGNILWSLYALASGKGRWMKVPGNFGHPIPFRIVC